MQRATKKRMIGMGVFLLIGWLIFAQSGLRLRLPDAAAKREFQEAGLILQTATLSKPAFPLHYVQTGSDTLPTLLFVHGSPGSWSTFKTYLKDADLQKKFRLVAIDRPGFGYSRFGVAMPLFEQATAIGSLFSVLQNGRSIYLVGHSYAGPLLVALAAQHPDAIAGIVILAGSINSGDERPEPWRRLFFRTPLGWLLPGVWRTSNAEIWYLKKDLQTLAPQFKNVRCAVWLMQGTKDKLVPYHNLLWAEHAFTQAARVTAITLPDAGHFFPWQQYGEVKTLLLQL